MSVNHIKEAVLEARTDMAAYWDTADSLQRKSRQTQELYARIAEIAAELSDALVEAHKETNELVLMGQEAEKEDLIKARQLLMSVGLHETQNPDAQSALTVIDELIDKNALVAATFKRIGEKTLQAAEIQNASAEFDEGFQVEAETIPALQSGAQKAVTHLDAFLKGTQLT